MTPQIRRFALMYLGLTIAAALAAMWVQVGAGLGLNIAVAIAAALDAADRFFDEQGRAPSVAEAHTFGLRGLLAVWAVFVLLGLPAVIYLSSLTDTVVVLGGVLRSPILFFVLLGAALLSGIYYLAIRWSYRGYGRLLERRAAAAPRA